MLPKWNLEYYVAEDGIVPFHRFIASLFEAVRAEAEALINLLEENGDTLQGGRVIAHGEGLRELHMEHVRLFYKILTNHRLILIDGLLPEQGNDPISEIRRNARRI